MLNVLSVIAGLQRNAGPSHTVKALCEHLSPLVGENVLAFPQQAGSAQDDILAVDPGRVRLCPVPVHAFSLLRLSFSSGFATALRALCRERRIQILHNNGLWLPCNHAAASVAASLNIPLITTPRGMLAPWCLAHKSWKKRLAWGLYQKRDFQRAACLHATAEHEYRHLRALGLRQPVAVIPNGIEAPAAAPRKSTDGPRSILFVGRIYPVKGLLNLVAAWGKIRASGWRIVIAGPDQAGHQAEVRRAIVDAGLEDCFEFPGSVHDEAKWSLYRTADLFVLPSFTENFGMVVAEALACGVPVITTRGAPWAELEERGCGWWVEIGAEPLAAALREAMALSDADRREMGAHGRRLVEEKYAWPGIAKQMVSVYEWVLGGGSPPECVRRN
ncbi:MAG: glycosyltransferase [Candidatus Sumerlaeota bacterium]|nr:glycosyltransferase [Candidatus Sumerlaeota bacterium]